MKRLLVVIALTGCNAAGLPQATLYQDGVFQVTSTVERDDTTPPVYVPPLHTTEAHAVDGKLSLMIPALDRQGPAGVSSSRYDLVGGVYAGSITTCGAQRDEFLERIDDGIGLTDRLTLRMTQTWSGVAKANASCDARSAVPDRDGETVAVMQLDITERCPVNCASVRQDLATGTFHCGPCP